MPNPNVGLGAADAGCSIPAPAVMQNISIDGPAIMSGVFEQTCTEQKDTMGVFTTTFCPEVKVRSFCGPEFTDFLALNGSNILGFRVTAAGSGPYCYARIESIHNYDGNNQTISISGSPESTFWSVIHPDGWFASRVIPPESFGTYDSCNTNCQKILQRAVAQSDIIALLAVFAKNRK